MGREKKTGCARDWKRKNTDAALHEAKNKNKKLRYSFVAVNQAITEAWEGSFQESRYVDI